MLRQGEAVLLEQVHVDEQSVGHHLLGYGHQLPVHRVGGPDDVPQVLRVVNAREVHQLSLRPQLQDDVRVEQVQNEKCTL